MLNLIASLRVEKRYCVLKMYHILPVTLVFYALNQPKF